MFEHLAPQKKYRRVNYFNWRAYAGLFFCSLAAVLLLFNTRLDSEAASVSQPAPATLEVWPADQVLVSDISSVPALNFGLKISQSGVSLKKIKININGLYQADFFSDIKLFSGGRQVALLSAYDDAGNIYFEPNSWPLAVGRNDFQVVAGNRNYFASGQLIQFSLAEENSVWLSYRGHVFSPSGSYPASGGNIAFVSQGKMAVFNNFLLSRRPILARSPATLADFSLGISEETADLKSVVFSLQGLAPTAKGYGFSLYSDGKLLAQTENNKEEIIFHLPKTLAMGGYTLSRLTLRSSGLPAERYEVYLQSAEAQGYLSGQLITFTERKLLANLAAQETVLDIASPEKQAKVISGWQPVYELTIKSREQRSARLAKISWRLDAQNFVLEGFELWVNGKFYGNKFKYANQILEFALDQPIIVDSPAKIQLAAKLTDQAGSSRLSLWLLPDRSEQVSEDSALWWSVGEQKYNSFGLSEWPWSPVVLTD